jgi:hypothetical protein
MYSSKYAVTYDWPKADRLPRRLVRACAPDCAAARDPSDDDARPAPPSQRCVRRVQARGGGQGPAEFVPAPRLKLVDEELKQLKRQRNENENEANLDWSVCTPPCLLIFPCTSPRTPTRPSSTHDPTASLCCIHFLFLFVPVHQLVFLLCINYTSLPNLLYLLLHDLKTLIKCIELVLSGSEFLCVLAYKRGRTCRSVNNKY